MYRHIHIIFIVKCVRVTRFSLLMLRFDGKAWFLLFCHPLKLYRIFSLLNRLLRISLKCQNPLLSYIWEKVHCKCTMQCTVHFIITLFNVENVLLCVIYQLNFTLFMLVKWISRYIQHSVLSAVFCNHSRSWNILPIDKAVRLYCWNLKRHNDGGKDIPYVIGRNQ
jgi:hypothetical protein